MKVSTSSIGERADARKAAVRFPPIADIHVGRHDATVSRLIIPGLAFFLASCTAGNDLGAEAVRAPVGYQPYCFPYQIDFVTGTASIAAQSIERLAAALDIHFRGHEWLNLHVAAPPSGQGEENLTLARQRAQTVISTLSRLGIPSNRVQVRFGPAAEPADAAWLTAMIAAQEAERLRVQKKQHGIVVC